MHIRTHTDCVVQIFIMKSNVVDVFILVRIGEEITESCIDPGILISLVAPAGPLVLV